MQEVQQLRIELEELVYNCAGGTAAKNRSRGTKYKTVQKVQQLRI